MKKFTLLAAICCFGFVFQAKAQSSDCEKDTTITASIFGGESYDFNGQILTEAGMYIDTLQSVLGCDSIVTLILNKYEYDINVPYINLGGTVVSEGAIKEINLSCVDNFQLEANILATGGTIYGYNVAQIPYNPPFPFVIPEPFAHSINLTHDDAFAEVAELPFPFCFYQNTYSQVLMGPNGNLSFNTSLTGQICAWQIPNTNFETDGMSVSSNYFNSIFGVMEDVDPSRVIQQGSGTFQWGILGQPGARAFVMSYNEVPLFQCNDIHNSYQTIMYEGTNIIEVYVKRRGQCGWNGGRGIIGVMNSNGTNATIAPGRNATDSWTTVNNGVNT
ncbi:MAG: hypothetical protein LBN95_07795, partial [Prevotellaceae bacterium]|nr:hypothetical protein [Prevotellaceae bacterium]